MSYLLDTHTVLAWLADIPLDATAREHIADPDTLIVVSAASVWEATIKAALGKLDMPEPLTPTLDAEGFEPLPITLEHAETAGNLPPHHRDPFDRMLIAQAQHEQLTIITRDPAFDHYNVPTLTC